jgi:hypothetical protein
VIGRSTVAPESPRQIQHRLNASPLPLPGATAMAAIDPLRKSLTYGQADRVLVLHRPQNAADRIAALNLEPQICGATPKRLARKQPKSRPSMRDCSSR